MNSETRLKIIIEKIVRKKKELKNSKKKDDRRSYPSRSSLAAHAAALLSAPRQKRTMSLSLRPRKEALTAHFEGPRKEKISLSLDLDRALPLEAARKVDEVGEDAKVEVMKLKKMTAV